MGQLFALENLLYLDLLQAILKEKTTFGQTSQGSPLFAKFCSNYYGTLEYKGHSDFNVIFRALF